MKRVLIILPFILGACGDEEKADTPEQKALKDECRNLLTHIVSISPQLKDTGMTAEARAGQLPIEEVQQCTAAEPEARACLMAAPDIAAVRKCIPSEELLACSGKATAAKALDIRAKCWAGDVHAADKLPAPPG